jgi:hypothetical protein
LAGVVAVAALAIVWLRAYRRGALSPFDEPIELLALFAVGLAVGHELALAVVYTGLYLRSLYGSRLRAAAGLAVYSIAHAATVAADSGRPIAEALEHLPALAIGCAAMQVLAVVLGRHERSLRRERIVHEASAGLVDARNRAAVYAATMEGVDSLGVRSTIAAVLVLGPNRASELVVRAATGPWLPGIVPSRIALEELPSEVIAGLHGGNVVAIDSPRLAGVELYAAPDLSVLGGVAVPLCVHGELRGFLAVFATAEQGSDEIGALATLAGEAALALAAIDAAETAAEDRSLERLTDRIGGMI